MAEPLMMLGWSRVAPGTWRMPIPGGWVYQMHLEGDALAAVFVPGAAAPHPEGVLELLRVEASRRRVMLRKVREALSEGRLSAAVEMLRWVNPGEGSRATAESLQQECDALAAVGEAVSSAMAAERGTDPGAKLAAGLGALEAGGFGPEEAVPLSWVDPPEKD